MMSRLQRVALHLACVIVAAILLCPRVSAQEQKPAPPQPSPQASEPQAAQGQDDDDRNPFMPEPAGPLPAGMTGSDVNDPRAKLTPGLYDAGETSVGINHVLLLKKPDAFQLGSDDPDNPKVTKTLGLLGVGDPSKMPKPLKLVLA